MSFWQSYLKAIIVTISLVFIIRFISTMERWSGLFSCSIFYYSFVKWEWMWCWVLVEASWIIYCLSSCVLSCLRGFVVANCLCKWLFLLMETMWLATSLILNCFLFRYQQNSRIQWSCAADCGECCSQRTWYCWSGLCYMSFVSSSHFICFNIIWNSVFRGVDDESFWQLLDVRSMEVWWVTILTLLFVSLTGVTIRQAHYLLTDWEIAIY